jgi:benzodiazapine receptor
MASDETISEEESVDEMRGEYGSLARAGWRLFVCFLLCFAAAAFGASFPPGAWYAELVKPPYTPPNWVFAPVWTVLYILMSIAAYRVWQAAGSLGAARSQALWFVAQLVLNAAWSALFFGLHLNGLALVEIVTLWLTIVMTIAQFAKKSWSAAALLLPYLAWVSVATYLNAGLWWLNRAG